ncbi:hypothetical protein COCON_G00037420 [Conger conger]|uniref:Uncharacterized protein n=1 Tax=Conger conger TaxID=82655 RepID=A0A9Q1I5Z5_CONCO|nr:hypothetical protein COCON_G00037420 [Conger conger]
MKVSPNRDQESDMTSWRTLSELHASVLRSWEETDLLPSRQMFLHHHLRPHRGLAGSYVKKTCCNLYTWDNEQIEPLHQELNACKESASSVSNLCEESSN